MKKAEQAARGRVPTEPFCAEFWARTWRRAAADSEIRRSQEVNPHGWQEFYDRVSDVWLQMQGEPGVTGEAVAGTLASQGLIDAGEFALDVGCGPGALALALAERGVLVTALDNSPRMVRTLEKEMSRRGLDSVETRCVDWLDYRPERPHQLVVASFFPPAFEPNGLKRLESWSRGACALVVGAGGEAFPFRRRIWSGVMSVPTPEPTRHLVCALNYLLLTGRYPGLRHLLLPVRLDLLLEDAVRYFQSYFALFGEMGLGLEPVIREALADSVVDGRLKARGEVKLAVIWWHVRRCRKWDW